MPAESYWVSHTVIATLNNAQENASRYSLNNLSNFDIYFFCKKCSFPRKSLETRKNTFRFQLVLELSFEPTVEELKNMSMKIYVSSTIRFMASSLDKLVSYLLAENFSLLDNQFPQHCSEDLQLLHQKEFYPYSFFDSHEKLQQKFSPNLEK